MTWAYDFFKTVIPFAFKSSFSKIRCIVPCIIPYLLNQSTMGKPRLKKSHEVKVPLFEVISTYGQKCIPSIQTASLATKTVQSVISVRKQVTLKHHVIKESVAVVVEKDMMGKAAPPRDF